MYTYNTSTSIPQRPQSAAIKLPFPTYETKKTKQNPPNKCMNTKGSKEYSLSGKPVLKACIARKVLHTKVLPNTKKKDTLA